jgi:hypothetical protein
VQELHRDARAELPWRRGDDVAHPSRSDYLLDLVLARDDLTGTGRVELGFRVEVYRPVLMPFPV